MNEQFKAEVQQTIRDVEIIRSLLVRNENEKRWRQKLRPGAATLHLQLHFGALILACSFFVIEIIYNDLNTRMLMYSELDTQLQFLGLLNMGFLLVVMLMAFYFLIYRSARQSKASFQEYIEEHFQYVSNMSFISDLFIKFVMISLIILAQKPEWMAPVLTLFVGDYLFQGRFFVLPLRAALPAGLCCVCIAIMQWHLGLPELRWSLLVFLLVCLTSLFYVRTMVGDTQE